MRLTATDNAENANKSSPPAVNRPTFSFIIGQIAWSIINASSDEMTRKTNVIEIVLRRKVKYL